MNFNWDIIGHHKIIKFLQNGIASGKISHAYLFTGPEGVGKSKIAEYFSASLLCQKSEKNIPCKKCIYCQQVFKRIHPDLTWLKKEEGKKNISIEQVRNLREKLSRQVFLNSYKIAIIEEAETLNKEAWNALLKTLEEPTKKTIIILITSNLKGIPLTIISRCQLIKFLTVKKTEIYEHFLNDLKFSIPKAKLLSYLSQGKPGKGIELANNEELLEKYKGNAKSLINIIKNKRIKDKFKFLEKTISSKATFLEARESFQNLLFIWSSVLRDCLLIKTSNTEFLVNIFIEEELKTLAKNYSVGQIKEFLKNIIQTRNYLFYNINPRLAIENLIIRF